MFVGGGGQIGQGYSRTNTTATRFLGAKKFPFLIRPRATFLFVHGQFLAQHSVVAARAARRRSRTAAALASTGAHLPSAGSYTQSASAATPPRASCAPRTHPPPSAAPRHGHEWFHCGIIEGQVATKIRERRCVVPEVRHTDALRN